VSPSCVEFGELAAKAAVQKRAASALPHTLPHLPLSQQLVKVLTRAHVFSRLGTKYTLYLVRLRLPSQKPRDFPRQAEAGYGSFVSWGDLAADLTALLTTDLRT